MRDLISGEAELDDEEDDESFDGETGEQSRKKRATQFDDSSEEEEDDDDEEEAAKVRNESWHHWTLANQTSCRSEKGLSTMTRKK